MTEDKLTGYRGSLRKALESAGAEIGDRLEVTVNQQQYRGSLMPRVETYDDWHLIIKMVSGYNVGLAYNETMKINKVGTAPKPEFKQPPLPEAEKGLPKVSIISTGGTIASRVDYVTGGVISAMTSRDLLGIVPELVEVADVDADILYSVFSEDIGMEHWAGMAKRAYKKIKAGADGIIFTHGTDTMSYSSAAISFALQDLPCPVIFVGSQRSSDRPSSDNATNLMGGVYTAAHAPFAEVCIGLHENTSDESISYLRGTKVRKCHTSTRYAFQPVNDFPIARYKNGKIEMLNERYRPRQDSEPKLLNKFSDKATLIKFHPDYHPASLEYFLNEGFRGIIIEATGLGQVHQKLWPMVERARKDSVFVGIVSQCTWGRVNLNVYSHGRELVDRGAVPMEDMHGETAYVKLKWCLGQTEDLDEVKKLMRTNLVGEYNPRTPFLGRME
ncbi:MAG: Glu-tRNA(Gln) amidotransferase subunit GatD [Candidatus Bathyarchaeota archaeon]|nr:Glu-tRNA(Gln) amidotransferase subunit GatD [Candidatus Bathyarchaeota archaeon]